ncbi:MAG: hypothetical protein DWI22_20615 [Planctomycetota bacterium]|nr:MAG: hypothetical protein DWI22_20615 [Planctomycetota bacterium]
MKKPVVELIGEWKVYSQDRDPLLNPLKTQNALSRGFLSVSLRISTNLSPLRCRPQQIPKCSENADQLRVCRSGESLQWTQSTVQNCRDFTRFAYFCNLPDRRTQQSLQNPA